METIWFVENGGKRRRGKKQNCSVCGKSFTARLRSTRVTCSHKCTSFSRRKRITVACALCGKPTQRQPSRIANSKHGFHFCSRACKDKAQRIGGIREIMPSHYGTSENRGLSRGYISKLVAPKCIGCGESRRYLLAVHHKDGNFRNNVEGNLEIVCFNCHGRRHLRRVNDQWVYCTKSLTPRELLTSV